MSAAGRVLIGFSKPYVARYAANAGVVTYSDGMLLARGVGTEVNPESSDDNVFRADNQDAESAAGVFTQGTTTVTVDGLFKNAAGLIFGWPEADAQGWTHEGDSAVAPYVGYGFVAKYMSEGVISYTPYVLTKGKFGIMGTSAQTQESDIDWQTQELSLRNFRDDTANHDWRLIGSDYTTEAEAEAAIKTLFNITDSTQAPAQEPTTEP
jgi:phi13 family phage major tail protein